MQKFSGFVIYIDAVVCLLLHSFHDCTFSYKYPSNTLILVLCWQLEMSKIIQDKLQGEKYFLMKLSTDHLPDQNQQKKFYKKV